MRHAIPTLLALFLASAAADELKSGPQVGETIPGPFHYLNVNGAHAGNPHCLVCEFGLRPAVLVFARESPSDKSPLGALLQKLDQAVDRYKNAELRAGVVALHDDFAKPQTRVDLVRKWQAAAKDSKHVVVAVDAQAGPKEYKIDKDAEVTVLLYNRHKVVANVAFAKDKLLDKDVTAILSAVDKMIGVK
jgi:hypothetical protein